MCVQQTSVRKQEELNTRRRASMDIRAAMEAAAVAAESRRVSPHTTELPKGESRNEFPLLDLVQIALSHRSRDSCT